VELRAGGSGIEPRSTTFETRAEQQWVLDAGLCNSCGNCDTWCPQSGGPWRIKPRLHRTRATYVAEAPADGILIDADGRRIRARVGGIEHRLEEVPGGWEFRNDTIAAQLTPDGALRAARTLGALESHALDCSLALALHALAEATLATVNPVSAAVTIRAR
jgi:ferredoxin